MRRRELQSIQLKLSELKEYENIKMERKARMGTRTPSENGAGAALDTEPVSPENSGRQANGNCGTDGQPNSSSNNSV